MRETKINRSNYEEYFLDYAEGRLDPGLVEDLLLFLEENPRLRAELEEFEPFPLRAGAIVYEGKSDLKRELQDKQGITDANFDEFAVAYTENDLDEQQAAGLEDYCRRHPEKAGELDLYKKLRLMPDRGIRYPGKKDLFRRDPRLFPRRIFPYISAAASVLVVIGLYFIMGRKLRESTPSDLQQVSAGLNNEQGEIQPAIRETEKSGPAGAGNKPSARLAAAERAPAGLHVPEPEDPADIDRISKMEFLSPPPVAQLPSPLPHTQLMNAAGAGNISLARTGTGDEFMTLKQLAIVQFKKTILREEADSIDPDSFTLWHLAEAGVRGVNHLTGWQMDLTARHNEEGSLDNIGFNSRLLNISRSAK